MYVLNKEEFKPFVPQGFSWAVALKRATNLLDLFCGQAMATAPLLEGGGILGQLWPIEYGGSDVVSFCRLRPDDTGNIYFLFLRKCCLEVPSPNISGLITMEQSHVHPGFHLCPGTTSMWILEPQQHTPGEYHPSGPDNATWTETPSSGDLPEFSTHRLMNSINYQVWAQLII